MFYLFRVAQVKDPPIFSITGPPDYSKNRTHTSISWMCECGAAGEASGYFYIPLERLWCPVCGDNESWEELCKQHKVSP